MRSFFLSVLAAVSTALAQPTNILIDSATHHLHGTTNENKSFPKEWRKPTGPKVDQGFISESNPVEWTLKLRQQNVSDDVLINLNSTTLGRLNIQNSERVSYFPIPPGAILEGTNSFYIVPQNPKDHILVSSIEIIPQRMRDVVKLGHVTVTVTDVSGQLPVPVRISVANAAGKLADLYNVKPNTAAWRRGMVYSGGKPVEFDIPEGEWTITATRGMEWSRQKVPLRIFVGQQVNISLPMSRDVDTSGYIAADTHLHTYTFSGHGDANVDERIYTLAGEGVELAIATDHNHFTDYRPRQMELGQGPYYTSVIGNEITTANGHLNGFPYKLDSIKPNYKETNWVKLVSDIRAKGAQFVILNHPRWPGLTNSPMAIWGLNRATGTRTNDFPFTMDAVELANSSYAEKNPDILLRDWFALLNHGERLWAVGGSDSHTVADPPGQSRTYIASKADNVAAIDVQTAIKEMHAGNMSMSYGIFATATANGAHMGQTTKPVNGAIDVRFHVGCPEWVPAKKAVVYLNGVKVAEQDLTMVARTRLSTNVVFQIPAPTHDAYLVCVAYGDGVKDPGWKTLQNYTVAITNPIFIDADGDGQYSSPQATARGILRGISDLTLATVEGALKNLDPAIGVQVLSLAKLTLPASELEHWDELINKVAENNETYALYRSPALPK